MKIVVFWSIWLFPRVQLTNIVWGNGLVWSQRKSHYLSKGRLSLLMHICIKHPQYANLNGLHSWPWYDSEYNNFPQYVMRDDVRAPSLLLVYTRYWSALCRNNMVEPELIQHGFIISLKTSDTYKHRWSNIISQHQAIIWTNAGILLTWPLETNLSEILIKILTVSFKKMHLKGSSSKWWPICLGLNCLVLWSIFSKTNHGPEGWGGFLWLVIRHFITTTMCE